jgi:hypothetical protein
MGVGFRSFILYYSGGWSLRTIVPGQLGKSYRPPSHQLKNSLVVNCHHPSDSEKVKIGVSRSHPIWMDPTSTSETLSPK